MTRFVLDLPKKVKQNLYMPKQWRDLNKTQKAAVLDFYHVPHGIKFSAPRKKSVRREAPILAAITQMLRSHPLVATVERRHVGAFTSQERYIRVGRRGDPDITGILKGGRAYAIEVKAERGRVSEVQSARLLELAEAGAVTGVARSVEDARRIIENG